MSFKLVLSYNWHSHLCRLLAGTTKYLMTMPHIERSTFHWNWANYPDGRQDDVSPWLKAFVNARLWIENK